MEPLLKITNIPIAFEMKVNHARLEYNNASVDFEISRQRGGFQIKSSPIQLHLDTFNARDSIRSASVGNSIKEYAQKGRTAAYEATATFANEGHLLLKAKLGDNVLDQIIQNHTDVFATPDDYNIEFIPQSGVEISATGGDLTIDYQLDKMNFDWRLQQGSLEFIPGSIEILISQKPEIHIEYIGDPLYVPPSADPNYEPLDVRA
nr:DUF6470 family protein [uncultured Anaerotignum sp.]